MDTQHINTNNSDDVSLLNVEERMTNGSDLALDSTGPTREAKVETQECEKLETLGCPIEEGVEKISLAGGYESSVRIEGNGDKKGESNSDSEGADDGSESESSTASSSSESSSSYETSDSSSSDSDDDDDAEVEVEEGEIGGADDDGGDDDDNDNDGDKMVSWSIDDHIDIDGDDDEDVAVAEPIRSKNELQDLPPVPPVDVTLESHHQPLPVGVVMSMLGAQVIVEGVVKHDPLNEGSILWITESRKPLGLVDEIFGPVKNPYYVVRYNSEDEVPKEINVGTFISFVPEFADHVLNNQDLYKKGYDASGANDEELSDEVEFSDDEKEAEYRKMQRMSKRGADDKNPGKRKNNRKKVSPKDHAIPTIPYAPPTGSHDLGNGSPFSGIGQGQFSRTTAVPPFQIPPSNAGPSCATSEVWTNGTMLPPQPPSALLPNGFPANGMPWYPQNTQISHQLPLPGIQFQPQLHPNQGSLPMAMFPGVQPNIFAQPNILEQIAQGIVSQNQMTFGMNSSPFQQFQPPAGAAQQGFVFNQMQSGQNLNLHSGTNPGAPPQFRPGAFSNRGRRPFRGGGGNRKGWRPAN